LKLAVWLAPKFKSARSGRKGQEKRVRKNGEKREREKRGSKIRKREKMEKRWCEKGGVKKMV
jgi:hypothetical protein